MKKVLISYYSRTGNTEKMANLIQEGVSSVDDIDVIVKKLSDTTLDDLDDADGIILGSPTYFGVMAAEVKQFIDTSVKRFGRLEGKVGGAFSSSGNLAGGNETTIQSILQAWLVHGMVVQGSWKGHHYGPVSVGAPDDGAREECLRYGKIVGNLVKRLG